MYNILVVENTRYLPTWYSANANFRNELNRLFRLVDIARADLTAANLQTNLAAFRDVFANFSAIDDETVIWSLGYFHSFLIKEEGVVDLDDQGRATGLKKPPQVTPETTPEATPTRANKRQRRDDEDDDGGGKRQSLTS